MANNNQTPQSPQNPQGHSPAASPAGQGQSVSDKYGIGALNGFGKAPSGVPSATKPEGKNDIDTTVKANTTQETPGQNGQEGTTTVPRQLTEKDERHFAQYVTKTSQEKYEIAKLAVETDENAIFKIAETDKDLAQRLLKEFDYGTDSVDDLLQKREIAKSKDPELAKKELENAKRLETMEKQLLEERILRLKGENPDLIGDVESTFREMYKDPAFSKYSDTQKISMARAAHGEEDTQTSANNVALAVLQREEGVAISPKGAPATEKTKVISPEMKKMLASANLTEKDLEVLPPNIEELIASQFGGMRQ